MAKSVILSAKIVVAAKVVSKASQRSVAEQIEWWANIGKIAEENPDLTYELIKDIITAQNEAKEGQLQKYAFDEQE